MRARVNFIIFLCALRRLRRDRSGASAVEFALVVPLVLVCIFGIFEIALSFLAAQLLETATQDSKRMIMTGQVKSTSTSRDSFKATVCDRVKVLLNCNYLYIDAQAYSSLADPTFPSPIENGKFVDNTKWLTGKQGDIVVVRTFYTWPVFLTNFFGYNPSNLEGGKKLLSASAAVRNEPW
jgi:Flp pilus assembly protein TadG